MDIKLRDALVALNDEDFYELSINVGISSQIRDLLTNGVDHDELLLRLDLDLEDADYALNGAFEFTTRHLAAIKMLQQEVDNGDFEVDDSIDDPDSAEHDPSLDSTEEVTNTYYDRETDTVQIGKAKELTPEEEFEYEQLQAYAGIIHSSKSYHEEKYPKGNKPSTVYSQPHITTPVYKSQEEKEFEALQQKTYDEYQAKLKGEGKENKDADQSGDDWKEFMTTQ